VGHRCLQTRYTELAEVVAIACQPGTLAGAGELADLAVGDQVGGGAITLVEEGEGAVARNLLVAGVQLVAAVGVGEQRAPGAVVHFTGLAVTRIPVAAAAETFGTSGHAAVLAVRIAVEVAQVALQVAAAERVVVHQAEEVLFVEVFQVAVVVLRGQVLGDLVVTTGEVEGIDELAGRAAVGTANGQAAGVGRATALGVLQLAGSQGQTVDFAGGDLAALEQLWQQATVVEGHDRQLRLQGAETQFGLGDARLGSHPGLAVVADRRAVGVQREQLTRGTVLTSLGRGGIATTAVQA